MSNEDVLITIAGDSAPLVAAAADASAAFGDMAAAAGSATADIAASMADLASTIDGLSAEIDILAASMDTLAASSATASTAIAETGAAATITATDMITWADVINMVTGALDAMWGALAPLLVTAATFVTVLAGWQILQDVAGWVENLVQQMFELDKQTQRVVNSWQYLFSQAPGGGKTAAQQLAGWAYQESPKLPFTAVDLRSGISTLGTIPGITPAEIEKFMPVLADIASTLGASDYGGQGINLQQASQAIVGAQFGLTRQLRYELHINPDELIKYGLVGTATRTGLRITDPSTLIPSIMRWAAARGLVGAAGEQETTTFWGAWSSFQDYIQNLLQTTGGIDPATGRTRAGSMFAGLQNLLIGVNAALGQAQTSGGGPLNALSGSVGNILGGGVSGLMALGEGILGGGGGAGAGAVLKDLLTSLKDFGEWLTSSGVQEHIRQFGEVIGQFLGQNLRSAQHNLPDLVNALQDLGRSFMMLWNSVTPEQRKSLQGLAGDIIQVMAAVTEFVSLFVQGLSIVIHFTASFTGTLQSWGTNLSAMFREWGRNFIDMLIQGIESKLGDLAGMLNRVGDQIKSHLGFQSPPREGVLATSDQWMPNMMDMFAQGIQHGLPAVARASQQAAAAIAAPLHGGYGGAGGVSSTLYGPTTNYGGTNPTLNMYGANQAEMNQLIQAVLQQLDRQHNVQLQQAGGYGYRSFGPIG